MNIKEVIRNHGYNITCVAEQMGITRETLTRNISGNPTYKTMKQIASAIGANVSEFFEDEVTDKQEDFASYIRYKGIHYTADTLDEFLKQVEELKIIAKWKKLIITIIMLVCTVYFVPFYRKSVKFVLKPSKCLDISKHLRNFAADLKTKHY